MHDVPSTDKRADTAIQRGHMITDPFHRQRNVQEKEISGPEGKKLLAEKFEFTKEQKA